jgi:hypothetical protein
MFRCSGRRREHRLQRNNVGATEICGRPVVLREKVKTRWNINISVLFRLLSKAATFFFTFIYSEPKKEKRKKFSHAD